MDKRYFSEKVAEWYTEHQRSLPWRSTKDPYKIWLSEIILQQTRVIQGTPYYLKFIETFPTVTDLAQAQEKTILRLWQGLGYYTRARNLHKCAKEIVSNHQAKFPDSFEILKTLPGIGDYTAAAIASIAYQERVAVVDGNVFRVLSRVFGIDLAINSPEGKKCFTQLANELIQEQSPDIYNQAVMEFGALFCVPKNPVCTMCIFQSNCFAYNNALQNFLPVKIKGKAARTRYFYYFAFQKEKSLLMKVRNGKDIWQGLYDFFLIEKTRPIKLERLIAEHEILSELAIDYTNISVSKTYKHILTHQIIHAKFIGLKGGKTSLLKDKDLHYYTMDEVGELPKPVLISNFLKDNDLL